MFLYATTCICSSLINSNRTKEKKTTPYDMLLMRKILFLVTHLHLQHKNCTTRNIIYKKDLLILNKIKLYLKHKNIVFKKDANKKPK